MAWVKYGAVPSPMDVGPRHPLTPLCVRQLTVFESSR